MRSPFKVLSPKYCRGQAAAIARERGQGQALVSVASLKAKLAGLLTEKIEVGGVGDFDACYSTGQIVDRVLAELVERFKPIDEQDRQGLIELYERQFRETQAFLDNIRNRPITAERVDTRKLNTPWQQLRPHSPPARLRGNGR
jgi:hypothetical protein